MNHLTLPCFWRHNDELPKHVKELAEKNYELLKADPQHPSLHFKKISRKSDLWTVRVGEHHRALAAEMRRVTSRWPRCAKVSMPHRAPGPAALCILHNDFTSRTSK
jgi:hypothetical protein